MATTATPESPAAPRPNTKSKVEENKPKPDPLYKWVTTCPTDWFALRVRGEDLVGVTHSVTGYYVDDNFEFKKETPEIRNVKSEFRAWTGRDFIGIPALRRTGLYRYKTNWNKFRTKQQGEEKIPVQVVQEHGEEIVTFTPSVAQYPLVFPGVEVIGTEVEGKGKKPLIPITLIVTVRVRMLRPRIALMQNVEWLGNVLTPEIRQFIKNWAPGYSYDELFRGKDNQVTAETRRNVSGEFRDFFLGTPLLEDRSKIVRSPARRKILAQAGVDLISIDVVDIIPNTEFEATLLEKANAYIKAETGVITADGLRRERELEGDGEAAYIDKVSAADERRIKRTTLQTAGGPGLNATTIELYKYIAGSKLTTYAGGQGIGSLGIIVGTDGKPIA